MPITDILTRNAQLYGQETALIEINPQFEPESRITWREYSLMQPEPGKLFRREMTWSDFDRKANRFANLLLTRGCRKGDKVAILLMNSLEWLPAYFGILRAGFFVSDFRVHDAVFPDSLGQAAGVNAVQTGCQAVQGDAADAVDFMQLFGLDSQNAGGTNNQSRVACIQRTKSNQSGMSV